MLHRTQLRERMLNYDEVFTDSDIELVMKACEERGTDAITEMSTVAAIYTEEVSTFDLCIAFIDDYCEAIWAREMTQHDNVVWRG